MAERNLSRDALPCRVSEPSTNQKGYSFSVSLSLLCRGDARLDATFYAQEALAAARIVRDSGFDVQPIASKEVAESIFNLPRFKRIYTEDPSQGWPYLSANEVFMLRPESYRWIARQKAPKQVDKYFVKPGWILVSCSGVLGRCVLATERLTGFFITHDLIRIVPTLASGYLYAFLSSWIGQALLKKGEYGGTVSHLEPEHIASIPVPLLPRDAQQALHEQVMSAYEMRNRANELLDEANGLLHAELGLPSFQEQQIGYLFDSSKPKTFVVKASELKGRFDASFHTPVVQSVIAALRNGKYRPVELGKVVSKVFIPPRFKRIYVGSEYGVPFLQGCHIPLLKPYDLKYLSRRVHANSDRWMIRAGWVLVTCSGTIGRVSVVPESMDGWTASQHIARIIPAPPRSHPGFVAAFLMTPYGQNQLAASIYGGVVDELTHRDIEAVLLPDAPWDIQERIGALVTKAFALKEEANRLEARAVARLEYWLQRGTIASSEGKTELATRLYHT